MRLDDAVFFAKRVERDVRDQRKRIAEESRGIAADMGLQASRIRVHMFNLMWPVRKGDAMPPWAIGRFDVSADDRELPR